MLAHSKLFLNWRREQKEKTKKKECASNDKSIGKARTYFHIGVRREEAHVRLTYFTGTINTSHPSHPMTRARIMGARASDGSFTRSLALGWSECQKPNGKEGGRKEKKQNDHRNRTKTRNRAKSSSRRRHRHHRRSRTESGHKTVAVCLGVCGVEWLKDGTSISQ